MPQPGFKTVGTFRVSWPVIDDPTEDVVKIIVKLDAGPIHTEAELGGKEILYVGKVDIPDDLELFTGTWTVQTFDAAGNAGPVSVQSFSRDLKAPPGVGPLTVELTISEEPIEPVE